MSDPIICCRDVCVAYGRNEVLHQVNLEIPRGVFLPFTGPNGAGKTTLLRAILGLIPIRHGKIITPFRQKPAGYVPQQRVIDPLYPVSARQIVAMGLHRQLRWPGPLPHSRRTAIDAALEQFGMLEHASKTFRELSGGMKQKILLARAFVAGADVIALDEPTSELDESAETEVLNHLLRLNREMGKTILMVHHDLDQVARLTNTMCRIRHGKAELIETGGSHA
ncbi:MAG: ATP-binding cassette domain-containing protein [Pontiellaceae bacterium]|nr:ATP-binding cassette domain-containing protein [Pontiellaceae bacterium]MBN2784309.1 ATP-binding cassette domain-containing protein [Pontiellaceae bacterium]